MNSLIPSDRRRFLRWLFVALSAADLALTWWLLRSSSGTVYEANPVARRILEATGWFGLASFKLLIVFLVLLLLTAVARHRPRTARLALNAGCVLVGLVVMYSGALAAVCQPLARLTEAKDLSEQALRGAGLDERLARSHAYVEHLRRLVEQVIVGTTSLEDAVAEMVQDETVRDPAWLERARRAEPEVELRDAVENRLLQLIEDLLEHKATAAHGPIRSRGKQHGGI